MSDPLEIIDAHGGLTPFYQAARRMFDYSAAIKDGHVAPIDRARSLAKLVRLAQNLESQQVNAGLLSQAVATRQIVGDLLIKLRNSIDAAKSEQK